MILKEPSRIWWYLIPAKWIIPFRRRCPEIKRHLYLGAGPPVHINNSSRSWFSFPEKRTLG